MPSSDTYFKKGNPGRPKGARNKLSTNFLHEVSSHFEQHGAEAIQKLYEKDVAQYCNVIGKLIPKLLEMSGPDSRDIPINGTVRFVKVRDDMDDQS